MVDDQHIPGAADGGILVQVAVGVAGLFLETHEDPDKAPSDGPNMIKINNLEGLLEKLIKIDSVVKYNV